MTWLINFFVSAGSVALLLTVLALMLTGLSSLPRWLGDVFARAPALDLVIALFTWVPWLAAGVKAGAGGHWILGIDYPQGVNNYLWEIAGHPPGTYYFEVDVRNQGTSVAYETTAVIAYTLSP